MAGKRWLYAAASLAAAATLVWAYSNHFDNDFHFDDSHVIVSNLAIRSLHDVPRFFTDTSTFSVRPQNASYRPLLTLSYALDYRLGGGLVLRQFHTTQFALLLLLGTLLVFLFRRIGDLAQPGPWNRWVALFAATLFCIHTANTETVNYLSSRSDLLATLGVVAAFVTYLELPALRRFQLHLLPMIVAGLAKPLTVMFAPLLVLFSVLFEEDCSVGRALGPAGARKLLAAVLRTIPALVTGAVLFWLLRIMEPDQLVYSEVDRWTYARTQPFVWLHYFRLFWLPRGLTADTDWTFVSDWRDPRLAVGLVFVAGLGWAILRLSRERRMRPAAFGLGWFVLALLPSSSIFPLTEAFNEHRLFFPFVGLTLAAAWGASALLRAVLPADGARARLAVPLAAGLAVLVVGAHGVGTYARNRAWNSEESLWRDVVEKSPRNGRGLMNYGLTLMAGGRLREALDYFERAQKVLPNYSILEVNLGIVKSALHDEAAAESHFKRAMSLAPDYAQGHYYFAQWLAQHGRAPEALGHLETALEISPADLEANRLLLELYAAAGDEDALATRVRQTLDLAPEEPTALALSRGAVPFPVDEPTAAAHDRAGWEFMQREEWVEAAVAYARMVQLDPGSAKGWNNLGWARGRLGFEAAARACYEKALSIDPGFTLARDNLLAERGSSPP